MFALEPAFLENIAQEDSGKAKEPVVLKQANRLMLSKLLF